MSGIAGINQPDANVPGIWSAAKERPDRRSKAEAGAETDRTKQEQSPAALRGHAEPQADLYVRGEKPESPGLYRVEKDAEGKLKIMFDAPSRKAAEAVKPDGEAGSAEEAEAPAQALKEKEAPPENDAADEGDDAEDDEKKKGDGVTIMQVTGNCDKVEAEIKKLKQEKAALSQQIQRSADDPDKRKEMQNRLQQVESELQIKDTDAYRDQHSVITSQRVVKRPDE